MWRVIYKESPLLLFLFFSFSILSSRGKSHKTLMTYVLVLCRESREFISSVSFQKKNDTLSASARAHAHAHAHAHARTKKKGDVEKAESKSLLLRTRERREWDRTVALHDQ